MPTASKEGGTLTASVGCMFCIRRQAITVLLRKGEQLDPDARNGDDGRHEGASRAKKWVASLEFCRHGPIHAFIFVS